ncbi:leucine-rich repeat-containing protein 52-like isoform X2 [Alosa alosa]|uniref:leucine-rich repeat-containing protein 52-like isoform X2 n=1 Tax=Alosa sapidissima TaxID=34773 RepID=UPI001C083305|nr:leucine-rich repeat-containing protein 52-like isoform X2 [Alosa sapidissima]XP_048109689.1 leucine-rich repeat-containing protein 52-like isoform X2 [Alosa alosa]
MRLLPDPSVQSLRLIFLLIFVMGVAPSPALTAGCPDRCVCDDQLVVQCAGQELTQFPSDLPLATRQLIISNNKIGDLPALQLNYLSDLVYLDCSNNSLTEISESTFGNLRKLAYLDLSFNTLTQIEDRTFGPLASLVMLRMTDNPGLSEIHPDAFAENSALQVLDVSRNNLTALNISSLIALPALRSLGLSGNPWRCDCDTEDLCLWIQIEGFKFQAFPPLVLKKTSVETSSQTDCVTAPELILLFRTPDLPFACRPRQTLASGQMRSGLGPHLFRSQLLLGATRSSP